MASLVDVGSEEHSHSTVITAGVIAFARPDVPLATHFAQPFKLLDTYYRMKR